MMKQNDPGQPPREPQSGIKQFCGTETQQDCGQKVRSGANELIANSCDNRAHWPDEILRWTIRRRNMAEPNPGGHILRRVGNQRKKQQGS